MNSFSFVVDGQWGDWSSWGFWSNCSVSCGSGKKSRTRDRNCDTPKPSNGGNDCYGDDIEEETEICNTTACPGKQSLKVHHSLVTGRK